MLLSEVLGADVNTVVDVVAVVRSFGPCTSLTSKAGKSLKKRDVVLVDSSGADVRLTLWNAHAELPDAQFERCPVMTVSAAKVGEFRGRNLCSTPKSKVQLFHDGGSAEVQQQRAWYQRTPPGSAAGLAGARPVLSYPTSRKQLRAIGEEHMGRGGSPAYCTVKATVTTVRSERAWYPACGTCSKKALEDAAGRWACAACRTRFDRPQNRYMLTVVATDASASQLITLFDDAGKALLGTSADDAEEMQQASRAAFNVLFKKPLFLTRIFELSVKEESREERGVDKKGKATSAVKTITRVNASRVHVPDFVRECVLLVREIERYG